MYNGLLYMAYQGGDSDDIWYNVFDGNAGWRRTSASRKGTASRPGGDPPSPHSGRSCSWPTATTAERTAAFAAAPAAPCTYSGVKRWGSNLKGDSAEKPIPVSQREKGMESKKLGG